MKNPQNRTLCDGEIAVYLLKPTHKMWTFENRTNSYTSKNLQCYNRKTKTGEKSYWLHIKHLTAKHVAAQEIKNSSQLMQLLYQQPAQTIETLFNYLSEIIYLNVTWIKDGFQKTSFWRRLKKHFAFKLLEILKLILTCLLIDNLPSMCLQSLLPNVMTSMS